MKKLLSIVVCFTIVLCTAVCAFADSTSEEVIENVVQRQEEALRDNTNLVNYFSETYGNKSRNDYEIEDSFPYYYGGSYINNFGELVVLVTETGMRSKSSLDIIADVADDPIIESCAYSYSELDAVTEAIKNNLEKNRKIKSTYVEQVSCWAVDDKDNCIYVDLLEKNDEIIGWFRENIYDSQCIVFRETDSINTDEINYSGQGVYMVGPTYFSGAFRVRRSTDDGYKYGFITCAHGNSLESTIYGFYDDYLGTVKLRRHGGAYDVSYAEMNSSDDFSNTITGTPYSLNSTNDDILYPTYGQIVYLYARNNKGAYGTITSTNLCLTYQNVDFSGLIGANYSSQPGDSGGLIASGAVDYGCNLVGVHKGTFGNYKAFTSAFKVVNLWYLNRY